MTWMRMNRASSRQQIFQQNKIHNKSFDVDLNYLWFIKDLKLKNLFRKRLNDIIKWEFKIKAKRD